MRKSWPGAVAIVGIEEEREVVRDIALIEIDAILHDRFVHGGQIEQVQPVRARAIPHDRNIVHPGSEGETVERHGEGNAGILQPTRAVHPRVGIFALLFFFKALAKQAKMVIQAHAIARQAQRGNGIQKARGQAAQAAIAQRRFAFALFHLRK